MNSCNVNGQVQKCPQRLCGCCHVLPQCQLIPPSLGMNYLWIQSGWFIISQGLSESELKPDTDAVPALSLSLHVLSDQEWANLASSTKKLVLINISSSLKILSGRACRRDEVKYLPSPLFTWDRVIFHGRIGHSVTVTVSSCPRPKLWIPYSICSWPSPNLNTKTPKVMTNSLLCWQSTTVTLKDKCNASNQCPVNATYSQENWKLLHR